MGSDIYVAKESFFAAELDTMVNKGERVRAGHPLIDGREELFEPADTRVAYDIEQATAAPGEKRGGRGQRAVEPERQEPSAPAAPEPAALRAEPDAPRARPAR